MLVCSNLETLRKVNLKIDVKMKSKRQKMKFCSWTISLQIQIKKGRETFQIQTFLSIIQKVPQFRGLTLILLQTKTFLLKSRTKREKQNQSDLNLQDLPSVRHYNLAAEVCEEIQLKPPSKPKLTSICLNIWL